MNQPVILPSHKVELGVDIVELPSPCWMRSLSRKKGGYAQGALSSEKPRKGALKGGTCRVDSRQGGGWQGIRSGPEFIVPLSGLRQGWGEWGFGCKTSGSAPKLSSLFKFPRSKMKLGRWAASSTLWICWGGRQTRASEETKWNNHWLVLWRN